MLLLAFFRLLVGLVHLGQSAEVIMSIRYCFPAGFAALPSTAYFLQIVTPSEILSIFKPQIRI